MRKKFITLLAISLLLIGTMTTAFGASSHTWRYSHKTITQSSSGNCRVTPGCTLRVNKVKYHYYCIDCPEVKTSTSYTREHSRCD